MARAMHGCGVNHRDFYLCHFMLMPDTLEKTKSLSEIKCHLTIFIAVSSECRSVGWLRMSPGCFIRLWISD